MKRSIVWRMTGLAVLITAAMATVAQAQQPTMVFSIRGIEALLDDADFLGGEVGKEGLKDTANQVAGAVTAGKGLAGIDQSKPLGIYWNAAAGAPEMPVVFLPVSDEGDLKALLSTLADDFKDSKGQWTATVNGTRLFGKLSGGYLFISPAPPNKLADPTKITNAKYDVSLDVSIASIPQQFKDLLLGKVEEVARESAANQPEPKSDAEKVVLELALNGLLATINSLVNDGDRLTFGMDVDQKTRLVGVDFALTGKANSGLAKLLTAYGKTQPAFAAIGSETAPLRMIFSHPTPANTEQLDAVFAGAKTAINDQIDKDDRFNDDNDRAAAKGLIGRLLDIFQSTAKSGSLHSGLVLEAGNAGKVRVIAGAKVANGDEASKLLDDVIKLSKENPDIAKVKVDAAKHAGARIHAITPDQDEDTLKYFGTEPAHLAIRSDSLWVSIGGDNLNALKKSLDAKPSPRVTTSPISLQIKPAALVLLVEKDDEDLIGRAKEIAGKPGDKFNVDVAPVPNGAKLRMEFGIDLLQLAEQEGEEEK
jgi:hypothetical protein